MHDPIAVKYAPDCDLQLNRSLIACHAVSELIQTKYLGADRWVVNINRLS